MLFADDADDDDDDDNDDDAVDGKSLFKNRAKVYFFLVVLYKR
jgi:hypothetical protein